MKGQKIFFCLVELSYEKEMKLVPSKLNLLLFQAARLGRANIVRILVQKGGADINGVDQAGRSAGHQAARNGHLDVLEVLHSLGANLNQTSKRGVSVAHQAAFAGHVDFLKRLVQLGWAVDFTDANDCTPLEVAIDAGQDSVVEYLEKVYSDKIVVTNGTNMNELDANSLIEDHDNEPSNFLCLPNVEQSDSSLSSSLPMQNYIAETSYIRSLNSSNKETNSFVSKVNHEDIFLPNLNEKQQDQLNQDLISYSESFDVTIPENLVLKDPINAKSLKKPKKKAKKKKSSLPLDSKCSSTVKGISPVKEAHILKPPPYKCPKKRQRTWGLNEEEDEYDFKITKAAPDTLDSKYLKFRGGNLDKVEREEEVLKEHSATIQGFFADF